jgi:hypothetical protein
MVAAQTDTSGHFMGRNSLSNWFDLTLSLLMSYIYGASGKVRNLTYMYGRDFLLGILLIA